MTKVSIILHLYIILLDACFYFNLCYLFLILNKNL